MEYTLRDTNTNEFNEISTHVYSVYWMNEEPKKCWMVGIVCYLLNVTNVFNDRALNQDSNTHSNSE